MYRIFLKITLPLHETIECLGLQIQLPGNVSDYRFGGMSLALFSGPVARLGSSSFRVRKGEDGERKIVYDTYLKPYTDLIANKIGFGLIEVKGAKINPGVAAGAFVLSSHDPSFKPAEMLNEGHFEYLRLGISISKALTVENKGVRVVQSAP